MGCCNIQHNFLHATQISITSNNPKHNNISPNNITNFSYSTHNTPSPQTHSQSQTIPLLDQHIINSSINSSNLLSKGHENTIRYTQTPERNNQEIEVIVESGNSDLIEINNIYNNGNNCINISNSKSLSFYGKRLDTIRETNSDCYESKRMIESNVSSLFKKKRSYNDDNNFCFISENNVNNDDKNKRGLILQNNNNNMILNGSNLFKHSDNFNGNILLVDTPIIAINQSKSLKNIGNRFNEFGE